LEDDIAFVNPRTRELYRWQADVYKIHPQLYEVMTVTPASGGSGDSGERLKGASSHLVQGLQY
jgi:hypothetical protein